MVDRDWLAIYAVVLEGLDDYGSPTGEAQLSEHDREDIAEIVTDHLVGSLTQGALRKPRLR